MSFDEEFEQHQKASQSTSDFYKFAIGSHVMRIMTEPKKKASRFGYGICYPGASYCDPDVIEKEYQDKMAAYEAEVKAAKARGATEVDIKQIKKPSKSNINVKWSVWALVRGYIDPKGNKEAVGEYKIVDLSNSVAEKLYNLKRDEETGTEFKEFPMPYDVKIIVSKKDTKGRAWTPKDIEYDLTPFTKRSEVTESELADFEKKTPIEGILERMYARAAERAEGGGGDETEGTIEYPKEDINPDDIPF